MTDFNEFLPDSLPTLGFGGIAGLIVGYSAKKLTKLAALALGVLFIVLQLLAYYGFVTVNWGAVQGTAEVAWRSPEGATLVERGQQVLMANLPFAGGFAVGFALGFKIG